MAVGLMLDPIPGNTRSNASLSLSLSGKERLASNWRVSQRRGEKRRIRKRDGCVWRTCMFVKLVSASAMLGYEEVTCHQHWGETLFLYRLRRSITDRERYTGE